MRKAILLSACMAALGASRGELIELAVGDASCTVDTVGARVVSYRVAGEEVLWRPEPSVAVDADVPWAHGGIPLAWPWFGRLGTGDAHIHGYAWRTPFAVTRRTATGVTLTLSTEMAELEYSVALGSRLSLRLRTVNRSSHDFPLGQAFHPYFRVGERDAVRIDGVDRLPICVTNAVDRGVRFEGPRPTYAYRIHDGALNRVLRIEALNSTGVNVWNPGAEKNCPGVIPGDAWRRFVAVEPYAMGDNRFLVLRPGEETVLEMKVEVEDK